MDKVTSPGEMRGSSGQLLLEVTHCDKRVERLYAEQSLTIGRSQANTVVLGADKLAARNHARIQQLSDGSLVLQCIDPEAVINVGTETVRELPLSVTSDFAIGGTQFRCLDGTADGRRVGVSLRAPACPFCKNDFAAIGLTIGAFDCPTCGQQVFAFKTDGRQAVTRFIPATFGEAHKFRVESFVARGGMGFVFKGIELATARPVAIKTIRVGQEVNAQARERFRKEVKSLKSVGHDNVVRLVGFGMTAGHSYLVMEWIDGRPLSEIIRQHKDEGRLIGFSRAIRWLDDVCQGVSALHNASIVHRDIKPANVLIDKRGRARVADLGIAKHLDSESLAVTSTGQLLGSYDYMAPEQRDTPLSVDRRADLYGLGVTFYEALTGARPVGAWVPASAKNPTVPNWFDTVLSTLLAPSPAERFQNIAQVISAIRKYRSGDHAERPSEDAMEAIVLDANDLGSQEAILTVLPPAPTHQTLELPEPSAPPQITPQPLPVVASAKDQPSPPACTTEQGDIVVCLTCGIRLQGKPETSYLGFKKYSCPDCLSVSTYPLRSVVRVVYWIAAVGLSFNALGVLLHGSVPYSGPFAIAAIVCLILDTQVRGRVSRAVSSEAREPLPAIGSKHTTPRLSDNRVEFRVSHSPVSLGVCAVVLAVTVVVCVAILGPRGWTEQSISVRIMSALLCLFTSCVAAIVVLDVWRTGEVRHSDTQPSGSSAVHVASENANSSVQLPDVPQGDSSGDEHRTSWFLLGGCIWGVGWVLMGLSIFSASVFGQSSQALETIGGLTFLGGVPLLIYGLLDKYVISKRKLPKNPPAVVVVAVVLCISGVVLSASGVMYPAFRAGQVAGAKMAVTNGEAHLEKGDFHRAIASFSEAISIRPANAEAYVGRGVARIRNQDYDEAIADCTEAIRLRPEYPSAYYVRGTAYGWQGKHDLAVSDLSEAIRLRKDYADAYAERAINYRNRGHTDLAIADFTEVIRITPERVDAYVGRGGLLSESGTQKQAIADCTHAIRLRPDYAEAYFVRGMAYMTKGKAQHAFADFYQAIGLGPGFADAYLGRGRVDSGKADYKQAIADFSEALRLKPDHWKAYSHRGASYAATGEYDRAISDYTEAIRLTPTPVWEIYYLRGLALAERKLYDRAISDFSQTIQMQPGFAAAYAGRSRVHAAMGELDRAKDDQAKAEALASGVKS